MGLSRYYVDNSSKVPLYKQVEQILSDLLNQEPYSKGEKLPNEIEIAKELNVSRNTVRKAMYALLHKNLIIRKKNRGTFKNIDNTKIKTTLNNWYSFNDDMQKQNRNFKIYKSEVLEVIPPKEVVQKLELPPNKKIIKLLRVKGYLEPEMYVESYIHPDLGLSLKEFGDGNIIKFYKFLEDKTSIKIVSSYEEISASLPTKRDEEYLSLDTKIAPILIRKMLILDEKGRKVAYSIGYYLSNRFTFSLQIDRKDNF